MTVSRRNFSSDFLSSTLEICVSVFSSYAPHDFLSAKNVTFSGPIRNATYLVEIAREYRYILNAYVEKYTYEGASKLGENSHTTHFHCPLQCGSVRGTASWSLGISIPVYGSTVKSRGTERHTFHCINLHKTKTKFLTRKSEFFISVFLHERTC
jgi:hypothetical protein